MCPFPLCRSVDHIKRDVSKISQLSEISALENELMRTQIITIILTLGAIWGVIIGASALHGSGSIVMTKGAAGALVGVSSLMFIWCIKSFKSLPKIKKTLYTHPLKRTRGALGPARPQSARSIGSSVGPPSHNVHEMNSSIYSEDSLSTDQGEGTPRTPFGSP